LLFRTIHVRVEPPSREKATESGTIMNDLEKDSCPMKKGKGEVTKRLHHCLKELRIKTNGSSPQIEI
jgi:hypothetical protein